MMFSFGACVTRSAGPLDSWSLHYLAPFAGLSIANHYRQRGESVLLILDDAQVKIRVTSILFLFFCFRSLTHSVPLTEFSFTHSVARIQARMRVRAVSDWKRLLDLFCCGVGLESSRV